MNKAQSGALLGWPQGPKRAHPEMFRLFIDIRFENGRITYPRKGTPRTACWACTEALPFDSAPPTPCSCPEVSCSPSSSSWWLSLSPHLDPFLENPYFYQYLNQMNWMIRINMLILIDTHRITWFACCESPGRVLWHGEDGNSSECCEY